MIDEAILCSSIHSTFEALVVQCMVGCCRGELGPSVSAEALQFSMHLINLLSILLICNGFTRIQKAVVDQTGSRTPVTMTFFGFKFGFWKCFGASSGSNHWANCHQLSYKIHLLLQVSNRSRNTSSLLHRIRDCDMSKQQFFDLRSAHEHPLIEIVHLSNLLQMLNDHRMADADFCANFSCSCKKISFDVLSTDCCQTFDG